MKKNIKIKIIKKIKKKAVNNGCLFCACGYNVSKMYTNCFRNVSRYRFRLRFRIKKRYILQTSSRFSEYTKKKSQNQRLNSHDAPRIAISQKLQELHLYFSLLLCMIYISTTEPNPASMITGKLSRMPCEGVNSCKG